MSAVWMGDFFFRYEAMMEEARLQEVEKERAAEEMRRR